MLPRPRLFICPHRIPRPPGDTLLRNTPGHPLCRKRHSPWRTTGISFGHNSPDRPSVNMATASLLEMAASGPRCLLWTNALRTKRPRAVWTPARAGRSPEGANPNQSSRRFMNSSGRLIAESYPQGAYARHLLPETQRCRTSPDHEAPPSTPRARA